MDHAPTKQRKKRHRNVAEELGKKHPFEHADPTSFVAVDHA
jgi:hypothetical protein